MSKSLNVAVIGGGITGLTAAYQLKKNGAKVSLFESSEHLGGMLQTSIDENWLAESNYGLMFNQSDAFRSLIDELEMRDDVMELRPAHRKRFYASSGKLKRLPNSLWGAIFSSYLPLSVRFKLLFGFLTKKQASDDDTLAHFIERYLGPKALPHLAEPLASIVYAGDMDTLRAKHAFPELFEQTQKKRSLSKGIVAALRQRKISLAKPDMIGFRNGFQSLVGTLANHLEEEIIYQASVKDLKKQQDQWVLTIQIGTETRYYVCDKVILAVPAYALSDIQMEGKKNPDLKEIATMPYAPLAVINMGFKRNELGHSLDGAGFWVPDQEGESFMGVVFTSSLIDERTPGGYDLITVFLGGPRNADLISQPMNLVKTQVIKDLNRYLEIRAYPQYVRPYVYTQAIPQFDARYDAILSHIQAFEQKYKDIHLAGQYRYGVGIVKCIEKAMETANSLLR
jgi:oxygen-dependent protoporphyrinogen oxidase